MADNQSNRAVRAGKRVPDAIPDPGLWIVATPIGNLGDWTWRAQDVLASADVVACEDTRRTGRLLSAYAIDARLVSYHDYSPAAVRDGLIERLRDGKLVALVSDAGTPLVSDPGYKLVRAAIDADIAVRCAPGPSSPLAALVLSGLPTDRFLFVGFPPAKRSARRDFLEEIADVRATVICLEAPHRIAVTLEAMVATLGDRPAAIAREITKVHEEVKRGTLSSLLSACREAPRPKGEMVIVVAPPVQRAPSAIDADALLDKALESMRVADAAAAVARATGLPRREIYSRALRRVDRGRRGEPGM